MKIKQQKIGILGCGWLGLPLAEKLIETGFLVNGTTTSQHKMTVLENCKITPFLIILQENQVIGNIKEFLENIDILIIDIPPKLRQENKENFVAKMEILIPYLEKEAVKKIIFVSSTSVYGEINQTVSEKTIPIPDTPGGKQLLEVEHLLQKNSLFQTTILRFGGLIGENRHPARFLAGKKDIKNPEAAINLIHQQDCICIIQTIIQNNDFGNIYNAVTPYHPTRITYYCQKAAEMNLTLPQFVSNEHSIGKIISSEKLITQLPYQFQITQL